MAARRYVVQRIGDQYIPVLQDSHPQATRATCCLWGTVLALMGLSRGGRLGGLFVLSGAALGYVGLTGRLSMCTWCGAGASKEPLAGASALAPSYQNDLHRQAPQLPADAVDEASMESFPASDPPARSGVLRAT